MDDAALRAYPLPEGVEDAEMNRGQLAEAFGVSTNTIDNWRREGMPLVQEGTNGQSYVFRLSECWAWNEARRADERAARLKGDESARQLRMHLLNVDDEAPRASMSPSQIMAMAQAEILWASAAQKRGQLIHTDEVEALLSDVFLDVRATMENLPDDLERELGLTPAEVETVIKYTTQLLEKLVKRIEAAHLSRGDDAGPDEARLAL